MDPTDAHQVAGLEQQAFAEWHAAHPDAGALMCVMARERLHRALFLAQAGHRAGMTLEQFEAWIEPKLKRSRRS